VLHEGHRWASIAGLEDEVLLVMAGRFLAGFRLALL
jgi:hypothetical protein